MTAPKMKPCPNCLTGHHLDVYKYESGWQYVECDNCFYFGPGCGSRVQAIKAHNVRYAELIAQRAKADGSVSL